MLKLVQIFHLKAKEVVSWGLCSQMKMVLSYCRSEFQRWQSCHVMNLNQPRQGLDAGPASRESREAVAGGLSLFTFLPAVAMELWGQQWVSWTRNISRKQQPACTASVSTCGAHQRATPPNTQW